MLEEAADGVFGIAIGQVERFGAFGLVVILLGGVIWWLLKDRREARATYLRSIGERDSELRELRDMLFTAYRENGEAAHKSSRLVSEAIQAVENMAAREQALLREREMDRLRGGGG